MIKLNKNIVTSQISRTPVDFEKAFLGLKTYLAFCGIDFFRTDAKDGPISFWVEYLGVIQKVQTLEDLTKLPKNERTRK